MKELVIKQVGDMSLKITYDNLDYLTKCELIYRDYTIVQWYRSSKQWSLSFIGKLPFEVESPATLWSMLKFGQAYLEINDDFESVK